MSIVSKFKSTVNKVKSAVKSFGNTKVGSVIKGAISKTGGLISGVKQAQKVAPVVQKYAPVVAKAVLNSVTTPLGITGLKQAKNIVNTAMPYNVSRNQALTNIAKQGIASMSGTKNRIQGLFSKKVNDGGTTGTTNENIILDKATAPDNISKINTTIGVSRATTGGTGGASSSPSGTNTSGLSVDSKATVAGLNAKAENDRLALSEAEKARALKVEQARSDKNKNWWQDLIDNRKTSEEIQQETRDQYGIDIKERLREQAADTAEYNVMNQELGQLEAAKNSQIAQTNDFLGSRNFLNNMVGKIERNAAPAIYSLNAKMSAKAAFMQAKAQNWAEADKLVAQTVEYAMADQKDYLDLMGKMQHDYQDSLDRIDPIYKDAFKRKYDLLTEQYNQGIADKTEMMNLAIKYGINVDPKKDTLADVQQRIIRSGGTTALDLAAKAKAKADADAAENAISTPPTEFDNATLLKNYGKAKLFAARKKFGIPKVVNLSRKREIEQVLAALQERIAAAKAAGWKDEQIQTILDQLMEN